MNKTILEAIKAAWDNDKATIVALIQQGEGGAEAFATNLLKEEGSKLTGIAGMLYGFVEPQLASFVAAQFSQYGPNYLYTLVDSWLATQVANAK